MASMITRRRAPRAYKDACHSFIQALIDHLFLQQIKRRLQYQYNKTQSQKSKFEMGSNNPMAILAAQLTGNGLQKPRQKTAYNLWGPENWCFIDPVFNKRVKEGNVPAKRHAALRSSIYKELFDELPQDKR